MKILMIFHEQVWHHCLRHLGQVDRSSGLSHWWSLAIIGGPHWPEVFIIIIIIIITRPKPAYGRQGLAGLWGQYTDQAGTFWGVANISLRAFSAQLG